MNHSAKPQTQGQHCHVPPTLKHTSSSDLNSLAIVPLLHSELLPPGCDTRYGTSVVTTM